MGPPQPCGGGGDDGRGAEAGAPSAAATAVAFNGLVRAAELEPARATAATRANCDGSGTVMRDSAPVAAAPSPRLAPAAPPPLCGSAASAASASASDDDDCDDDDGYSSRGVDDGSGSGSGSDSEREAGASFASAFGGTGGGDAEGSRRSRATFRVLDDEAIAARQAEAVAAVDAVLRCGAEAATLLLRHYRWQPARVHEEWFQARMGPCAPARRTRAAAMPRRPRQRRALTQQVAFAAPAQAEPAVRAAAGLPPATPDGEDVDDGADEVRPFGDAGGAGPSNAPGRRTHGPTQRRAWPHARPPAQRTCGICFDTFPREQMASCACPHAFCRDCWAGASLRVRALDPARSLRISRPRHRRAAPAALHGVLRCVHAR
jgi:hypothetical protein